METNKNTPNQDRDFHANNAYSGSGSMQPGGSTGEAGRLSDYPDGNLSDNLEQIQFNSDDTKPQGRTTGEATDPSKLDEAW